MIRFIPLLSLLVLVRAFPQDYQVYQEIPRETLQDTPNCGYKSCTQPKPGMLNVHLVPHTHDDVGWLKTVDQYYFGSRNEIQNAGVQYIIDSVVMELLHDPKKKFVYVETAFFWKWWKEQEDYMKHRVKQLVKNGQLEFIGGAWSMNDEATTHYQSILDQFTWGFRILNDTFGQCGQPRIGWQIDPFGHSKEMASMMAHFGFDGLFFGRLDYQDKQHRMETNTMEMIWEGSESLGPKAEIFTGTLYNLYQAPRGFCFDIMCRDEPIIDDIHSPDYNVDRKVTKFLEHIEQQNKSYRKNEILLTMGGDFNYLDAHYYFKNLDKLIRHVNERQKFGSRVNVFYSTPSCYVKSLNDANLTWPVKQDDFFPYASDPHAYWTGYFTSRPTLKYFERLGNNLLQMCKQISSIALLGPEDNPDIDALREAMGIMQHHDAITGTEKQHVAFDYARILHNAIKKCEVVSNAGLNKIMTKSDPNIPPLSFKSCLLSNVSECSISSQSHQFIATVYNPLSRPANYYVRLPVSNNSYSVKTAKGMEIINQIVPIPKPLIRIPERSSPTTLELVFKADSIPPLGYKSYYITKLASLEENIQEEYLSDAEVVAIGDDSTYLTIDAYTGSLTAMSFGGRKVPLYQTLEYYTAAAGHNDKFENRASGAYIFRPSINQSVKLSESTNSSLYKGPIVHEVHQVFNSWASQVIRQYIGEKYAEVEWMVGPIPIDDLIGKEIISKYHTSIENKGTFDTDSNGRQTVRRKRNFRPTWPLEIREPISGNYYPITTDISINDGILELTVLTDRAQGGSSLKDGEIELMLHRRLLYDDSFGVDEALNEEAYGQGLVARGRHWIIIGNVTESSWAKQKRHLQQEKVLSPQVVLTDASTIGFDKWSKTYKTEHSGLTQPLHPSVQILTLEPWKGKTYLLRLEHLMDKKESPEVVTVNLNNLFSAFDIVNIKETALGGDRWLNDVSRLEWRKESNEILESKDSEAPLQSSLPNIILKPKEIRTFICDIKPKTVIPFSS